MPANPWESKPDNSGKYDFSVINLETITDAQEKYHNSKEWQNFAKLGIKNPFLKKIMLDKYNNTCQFCHRPIKEKFVLHHLTYDYECNKERVKILSPTKTYPERTLNLPDCENCDNKEECISRLVPVHSFCNKLISDIRGIMVGEEEKK